MVLINCQEQTEQTRMRKVEVEDHAHLFGKRSRARTNAK